MSDQKINKMFENIKDSSVLKDLLETATNPIEDVKIEMQELGNGGAAETLPNNKIIINDDIDLHEVDDFVSSRLIHEISHALSNDNYLDRPEEIKAFFVQVKYLLEQGRTPNEIRDFLLPIFKNFKSKEQSLKLINDMIELATKQNETLTRTAAEDTKTKIVVVGDSIAVGTGRNIPGAIVDAEIGISTRAIASKATKNKDLHGADLAIISAGTNDYPLSQGGKNSSTASTLANIQAIRSSLKAKKYIWILPYNRQAASDIQSVISGDTVVDLQAAVAPSKDTIHPSSYAAVASAALAAGNIHLDNSSQSRPDLDQSKSKQEKLRIPSSKKGSDVMKLQQALDSLGYDIGSTGIDGIQGPSTTAAITAFQADFDLNTDGIAGPKTIDTLNQQLSSLDKVAFTKLATTHTIAFSGEEQSILDKVQKASNTLGITTYLAGGIIRDKILNKPNQDLDFVTDKDAEKLAFLLAKTYKLSDPVHMARSGATMIHLDDKFIDLIDAEKVYRPVTGKSLEQGQEGEMSIFMDDAYRRDLTMNSLMYNLETKKIIDPTGKGFSDLENKVIRTIIDPHLKYRIHAPDMLRAIRFYATNQGFVFAPEMLEAMKENAHRVLPRDRGGDISPRRIERELRKAFQTPEAWLKMKGALEAVGLSNYIGEQIEAVDQDRQGGIEYNFDKTSQILSFTKLGQALDDAFIEGPQVQIDPSIQRDVQEAVNDLRQMDPNIFKGVGRIVALTGGPFGEVTSTDPTTVHINLSRIKQEVQKQIGSQYNSSDPEHKKVFDQSLRRSIVETIAHEIGHVKDFDLATHKFKGGEGAAESAAHQALQKLHYDQPMKLSENSNKLTKSARLVFKYNPNKDKKEWALVSTKDSDKVLEWYGSKKPSKDRIEQTEKRVQYFKHTKASVKPFVKRTRQPIHDVSRLIRRWKEIAYDVKHPVSETELAKLRLELEFIEEKLQEVGMSKESLKDLAHQLHTLKISSLFKLTKLASKPEEVASIALVDENSNLLIGVRTDDETFALPGGHIEQGETPSEAIIRELEEEADLEITEDDLSFLGSKLVEDAQSNNQVLVHSFSAPLKEEPSNTDEMTDWQLVDATQDNLPPEIDSNLHNKDNDVTLQLIGLQPKTAAEFNHTEVPSEDLTPALNSPPTEPYKDSYAKPWAPQKKHLKVKPIAKSSASQRGVPDDNLSSSLTLRAPYDSENLTPRESLLLEKQKQHTKKRRNKESR